MLFLGFLNAWDSRLGVRTATAATVAKLLGLFMAVGLGIWWMVGTIGKENGFEPEPEIMPPILTDYHMDDDLDESAEEAVARMEDDWADFL